jgi:nicotinamide mononucleotide (NMN) deamidase PncC
MDALVRRQVERIHASPTMAVVAVTGGGVQALGWLHGVPGASRTMLNALVPYASSALTEFLGYEPGPVAAPATARAMARTAHERAHHLAGDGPPVVGIGTTATLATDRQKRGEHRCFTSAWTDRAVTTYGVAFAKGLRDRPAEEEIVSRLVLRALAVASDVDFDLAMGLDDRERLDIATEDHGDLLDRLLAGAVRSVTFHADGRRAADESFTGGVLPGSFDPLHRGHEELADAAAAMLEAGVVAELSAYNVDKPPLEREEVLRRVAGFTGKRAVIVTRTATFSEKARLFPGCTFVIGWDTAVRLLDPRYYERDRSQVINALTDIRRQGCRFLVAGRLGDAVFRTLSDVMIPAGFDDMFIPIPESAFRRDLSSTQLRVAGPRS